MNQGPADEQQNAEWLAGKTRVGVPHVRRRINEVRNSSYDIFTAILDILDNVSKGYETIIEFDVKED